MRGGPKIDSLECRAYRIPTDTLEADGTLSWNATTMIVVRIACGGKEGLGYTYSSSGTVAIIRDALRPVVEGAGAFEIPAIWNKLLRSVRNFGLSGVASCAISAVDAALWDLKAKLIDIPLFELFGSAREEIAVYGSGGFLTYSDERLAEQLSGWSRDLGCRSVKMKIGSDPRVERRRIATARDAIGPDVDLFVDANGACTRTRASKLACIAAEAGRVSWFEEPITSDDLAGLRSLRESAPPGMVIAAGEYGFDPFYFRAMLEADAVDVLQIDVTRCLGYSGFQNAAALALAANVPVSTHCAPSLHRPIALAVQGVQHCEWFHDHVRIEQMLLEGAPHPREGMMRADASIAGVGIEFKEQDADRFAI